LLATLLMTTLLKVMIAVVAMAVLAVLFVRLGPVAASLSDSLARGDAAITAESRP
jgi:hypothetical protein